MKYTVRDATKECFQRYLGFELDEGSRQLCQKAIEEYNGLPIDKLSRWLGYIQGVIIERNLTTIQTERDFSRPLFHKAYKNENIKIPKSIDINK